MPARRRDRIGALLAVAPLFAGCAGHGPELGTSVVVPLSDGEQATSQVGAYYASVLSQMREAARDHDEDRLRSLLAIHDREDAPQWARDLMAGFRSLATSSWAAGRALAAHGSILHDQAVRPAPGLEMLHLSFSRLDEQEPRIVLGAKGKATGSRFRISVRTEDHDPLGGRVEGESSKILDLDAPVDLRSRSLDLPFLVEGAPEGSVLHVLEVSAELMPGRLRIDGEDLPCQRTQVASTRIEIFPRGVEPIQKAPLLTLREALRIGDRAHYPHVWLAARFLAPTERDAGAKLLIDVVRLGSHEQARVAMAALTQMYGDSSPAIGDREAWLAWWQRR